MSLNTALTSLSATPRRRTLLVMVSGGLLALCFPPYYLWFLFPLPFVGIYLAMDGVDWREGARLGAVFAVDFYLLHTYWFVSFHPLALPFMLIWLGIVHAVWAGGVAWVGWTPFSATAGWVLIQWFLGVGYHAFPWSRLATALAVVPSTIQPTRYLGELVWGGLLVLCVFLLTEWLLRRQYGGVLILVAVAIGLGMAEGYVRYHFQQVTRSSQKVTMVQPNVASSQGREDPHLQLRRLSRMTESKTEPGDLVIWPETAVMREPLTIAGDSLRWRTVRWRRFFRHIMKPDSSLLFGLRFTDPLPNRLPRLNGAAMLGPGSEPTGFYTKRRPVPGGEHLPFMGQVEWIRQFGRMVGTLGYRAGEKGGLIPLQVGGEKWPIGVQICFEDAFSQHVRGQVNRGADLLVNISNDSWSRSRASHWQHFYRARVRAIESGRMVLRNGTTGVSALIDPIGRLTDVLAPYEQGVVTGSLAEPLDRPLFTQWGDWITMVFVLLLILTASGPRLNQWRRDSD